MIHASSPCCCRHHLLTIFRIIIVDANSASPQLPGVTYYGIEKTHSGMCKFDSPNAPGYRNISTDIRQWVIDAPTVIQVRWEVEEEERKARAMIEVTERMTPYTTPHISQIISQGDGNADQAPLTAMKDLTGSSPVILPVQEPFTARAPMTQMMDEPLFIHPERFRPNSYFRGRQQELEDLHQMLMDKRRREQGTSAVLIWAVPGGGKSCLAREYAFRHRYDYPGGIFWIRGKVKEDLEDGFLKMAKSPTIRADIRVEDESDLQEPGTAIPLVRKWLNRNENWLLILDGILRDTPRLSKYIPDGKNTSLIFTSTDSSIAGNHKFDAPRKIELGPLDEDDAQIMLLEEMDKKKPWTQDDLSRALEAVRLMGCLPLAIHAAAKQLRATREPLSKYIRSYRNRPRAGGLGAYKGVREKLQERGETAALNLMYLLSFFTARVPVELLALGLKALDKRTPVLTRDSMGKGSLNKTFTVLIAFALIERDEIEDIPSRSNTSPDLSRQSTRSTELLDVLKIHCVVQTFFRETLEKENQVGFWLERAAAVFCRSFDEGNERHRRNPEVGLPDDYRRYAAQCRKILEHISRVDKPTAELRAAEAALQSRLGDIQGCCSTLSSAMTTDCLEEDGKGPHVSIFERTNSLSMPSPASAIDDKGDGSLGVVGTGSLEPLGLGDRQTSSSTLPTNVPYPQQETIPGPPEVFDYEHLVDGGASSSHDGEGDEGVVLETHRTVRRQNKMRYHDRAGAWRETKMKVTEPRVSISKAVALGQFSSIVSTLSQPADSRSGTPVPVFTDAGQHLFHIQSASQHVSADGNLDEEVECQKVGVAHERSTLDENSGNTISHVKTGRPRGYSSPSMATRPIHQLRTKGHLPTRDALDENPFVEGSSFGGVSIPSPRHGDSAWRPPSQDGLSSFSQSHSDSCLETDIGQWAPPGLPIVVSSTSTLSPVVPPHRPPRSHRGAPGSGIAGQGISSSLPNSHGTTLRPTHWHLSSLQPDGYSSQPLSRHPSSTSHAESLPTLEHQHLSRPTSRNATSRNVPIQTRRAPSLARTEPSPRITTGFEDAPTSYQVWQQRHHAGPWSSERASPRWDAHNHQHSHAASSSSAVSDAVEMVRSGSGGIQFNGRIVEFGQSPLGESVYPLEIPETEELLWEQHDEASATMSRDGSRSRSRGRGRSPLGLGIVEERQAAERRALP
ncbi:hypothetical protein B0T10DRAFT_468823 [Thelonectria olida]|uniref:NB-ARC domain-containing protein n=1 Tax=Thelonectria olida TaxID=1576542 RepID=A0A9P8WH41_9HYPO|nr:hypothetical protein B0T10DRAFT_468823 [Thelonectria olida]